MSNSIITSLCWIKKNWAKSIPLEYETVNDEKFNKVKKLSSTLKQTGKLKGTETIKESTQIIEDNIDMEIDNDDNKPMPVFCEDLNRFYNDSAPQKEDGYPDQFDDISDEDEDDFTIHPKDNLIACGTAQDDYSNMEIYVFDEDTMSLYVHHDIVLTNFPLCLEWLPYKNNQKANYAIVSSFTPEIDIWNLDILDVLEPEIILGKSINEPLDKDYNHSGAIISINLNPLSNDCLASGGDDGKVLLWDLNSTPNKAARMFKVHTDKVQSVKWNKSECNILASASFDKTIRMFDIRQNNNSCSSINVHSDIECIDWSLMNKFHLLSSYENGRVDVFDLRMGGNLLSFQAHKKEATSVAFSPQQQSLFVSVGRDSRVKIWDMENTTTDSEGNIMPGIIMEKTVKKSIGELFCAKFADDCDYTIAVGGSKGELLIWQLEESPVFCSRYGLKYDDEVNMEDKYVNLNKKKKLSNRKKK